jgi:hypothetical protein
LAPLTARSTWRRWGHLIVGGALLMPYMMAGEVVAIVVGGGGPAGDPLASAQLRIFVAVLPVVALSGLVLPVRGLESAAATELLAAPAGAILLGPARGWPDRWRAACWFALHLGVGGLLSGLTLALPPFAVWLCALPFFGDAGGVVDAGPPIGPGWERAWAIPAGLAVLLGLIYLAAGAGAVLARLAPPLLGPSTADRVAELERRASRLAERNRLARELHDSVGHALSVVTLQAGAAAKVLDRDPAFARQAFEAIAETARGALEDLDHVLGLLRAEGTSPHLNAPQPTLRDLDALLGRTRLAGTDVSVDVSGRLDAVPAAVSREAYRIVQEGLTNALRHAGPVPVTLRLAVRGDRLDLEMGNPLGASRPTPARGGRGLAGIRERVAVLRGNVTAASEDGRWRMRVSLPI